jgi:ADP-ribose pyrophosphatase YjhB (NUDIX family)
LDREYPERPTIGVGVVVLRARETLLVQRSKPPRQGQWSLPGGLQELGETVFETACREVLEETGVAVRALGLIDVIDLIERDPGGGSVHYHYTLVDVAASWVAGDAKAGTDAADVAWADVSDLTRFQLWSETERMIQLAHQKWPSGV